MNNFTRFLSLGSILSTVSILAGCVSTGPSASTVLPKSVPDISVQIDCGKCQVRSTVPESIHRGYAAAAAKAGVEIENERKTTVTIRDYTERGIAVRTISVVASVFVPPLALVLKDEIKADAMVDGKQVQLEYHYRIPFFGIESVAQKLGEQSFYAVNK